MTEKIAKRKVNNTEMALNQMSLELLKNKKRYLSFLKFSKKLNSEEQEDVLQEAFIKLFSNSEPINNLNNLFTHILSETAIRYIQEQRTQKFRNAPKFISIGEDHILSMKTTKTADKFLQTKQQCSLIQNEINKLPKNQRIAVNLYYIQNLDMYEVSKVLNCSPASAKTNWKIGRNKIKEVLKDKIQIIDWE